MGLSLYELQEEMQIAVDLMDDWAMEHEGDITDFPLDEEMKKVEIEMDDKLLSIAAWIKSIKAEAEAYRAEKAKIDKKMNVAKHKAERLTNYIKQYLEPGKKIKNEIAAISWRKNSALKIPTDITPNVLFEYYPDCVKSKLEFSKTDIKNIIKAEGTLKINGLEILIPDTKSIQIK